MKKGFTLLELLVSMTIMALVLGFALVSYQGARKTARDGRRKADLEEIRGALEMCRTDTGSYPLTAGFSFGGSLTCDGNTYISPVPTDPINNGTYYYYYDSADGKTYNLCANLLETGGNYCVQQP